MGQGVPKTRPIPPGGERRRTPTAVWIILGCSGCFVLLFCSGIFAAIAIPNLFRARMAANEASAIGNMRTIVAAESYAQQNAVVDSDGDGIGEYLTLDQLDDTDPPLVSSDLATGLVSGYRYAIVVGPEDATWYATAVPTSYMTSGTRTFYVDESGVVRGRDAEGRVPESRAEGQRFPPVGG